MSAPTLSHWRKRLGGKLELLLAESLREVAHGQRGTAQPGPQAGHGRHHGSSPKTSGFPTDAKLLHAAIKGSTAWPTSTACGFGNPTSGSPGTRR